MKDYGVSLANQFRQMQFIAEAITTTTTKKCFNNLWIKICL